jgi:hypothetical protein
MNGDRRGGLSRDVSEVADRNAGRVYWMTRQSDAVAGRLCDAGLRAGVSR